MRFASIKICSLFGIPIRLHYSFWLIVVPFLVILANSSYPRFYADFCPRVLHYELGRELTEAERWTMSVLTTLLVFGSLLAHEFGHAMAAKRLGIPVHSVELFVFGGVARMMGFTRRPRDEFLLAGSGPLVSLSLALLLGGTFLLLRFILAAQSPIVDVAGYASLFNLATLAFNLIPAYPLDGGRVLQGVLWRLTRRRSLAAAVPAGFGWSLAALLVVWGLVELAMGLASDGAAELRGQFMAGLWPILIGAFIAVAAHKSYNGARVLERISGLRATHVLDDRVQPLPGTMDLLSGRLTAFPQPDIPASPVLDGEGRAAAVLVNGGTAASPADRTVFQAAVPVANGARLLDTADLFEALVAMARAQHSWLIVEDASGRYVGMVTQRSLRAAFSDNHDAAKPR